MSKTYKTSDVVKMIGIHPNTVRLYEELGLIPVPERKQNGLRKKAIEIIKTSASGNLGQAKVLADDYLQQIIQERLLAEEAITIVRRLLAGENEETNQNSLTRKEAADYLEISMDTLRNWELNGLLTVKRKHNGYRVYTDEDIRRLKIIRSLRCANYSLSAILRMLGELDINPDICIEQVIDSPSETEDIITVYDMKNIKIKDALHFSSQCEILLLHQMVDNFYAHLCAITASGVPRFAVLNACHRQAAP